MKPLLKLRCNENAFNLYVALFFTFILNAVFLIRAWEIIPYAHLHDYFFAAALPVVLVCAFLLSSAWLRCPGSVSLC